MGRRLFLFLFLGNKFRNRVHRFDDEPAWILVIDMHAVFPLERHHDFQRIHRIYLDELAKHSVKSGMGKFIDESAYAKSPA